MHPDETQAGRTPQFSGSFHETAFISGRIEGPCLLFEVGTARFDFDRDMFLISATYGIQPIEIGVSREALEEYARASTNLNDPLTLYLEWEAPMQELAAAKFARNELEPDGSVLVRSGDGF